MDRAIEGLMSVADPVKRKPFIDQLQLLAQEQVPSVNLLELHLLRYIHPNSSTSTIRP